MYNIGVYCYKRWFDFHQRHVEHVASNLQDYLYVLSPRDRLVLGKYYKHNGQFKELRLLITNSHQSETELYKLSDIPYICTLPKPQSSTYANYELVANAIQSLSINFDNEEKEKSYIEYQQNIYKALMHTQEKKGSRATTKKESKKSQKDHSDNQITSIIIPSVPNFGVICNYFTKTHPDVSKHLPAQSSQQILKKLEEAYKSYFALIAKGIKAKPPKYNKKNHSVIIFQKDSFHINNERIRLSVGTELKKYLTKNYPSHLPHVEKNGFLYLKYRHKKKFHVNEIEVVPKYDGDLFDIVLKYDQTYSGQQINQLPTQINHFASIDPGVTNLATLYIPGVRPYIVSGSEIKTINYETKRKIAKLSSYKKCSSSPEHSDVWMKRENLIHNYMHQASRQIVDICVHFKIKKLIFGLCRGWKVGVNMGRSTNDMFYKVPYRKFINMLFYKCEYNGIEMVETNESYTSKVDALGGETVGRHEKYMGKRVQRGLFRSSIGCMINADTNGAINIMRKYVFRFHSEFVNALSDIVSRTVKIIQSPLKSGIVKRVVSKPHGIDTSFVKQLMNVSQVL